MCLELRGSCLIFLSHGRQLFCELRDRGLLCLYHSDLLSLLGLYGEWLRVVKSGQSGQSGHNIQSGQSGIFVESVDGL